MIAVNSNLYQDAEFNKKLNRLSGYYLWIFLACLFFTLLSANNEACADFSRHFLSIIMPLLFAFITTPYFCNEAKKEKLSTEHIKSIRQKLLPIIYSCLVGCSIWYLLILSIREPMWFFIIPMGLPIIGFIVVNMLQEKEVKPKRYNQ